MVPIHNFSPCLQYLNIPQNIWVYSTLTHRQGWEFALSLFCSSLKITLLKERPWAIHSCKSLKNSDCEWITLVALYKRVTWVIRLFFGSKSHFRSFALKNIAICLNKFFVLTMFLPLRPRAICSRYSLLRCSLLRFGSDSNQYFALLLTKNKQFAQKTKERIANPAHRAGVAGNFFFWYFTKPFLQ